MVDNNTNKIYKTFKVGGDPTKIAFLAGDLSDTIDKIQSSGWIIERIDSIDNTCAWDSHKQKYVSTTEYIIIAYRNACGEEGCAGSDKEPEQPKKLRIVDEFCPSKEELDWFVKLCEDCAAPLEEPERPKKELTGIAKKVYEKMLADHHCYTCKHSGQVPHYEMGKDAGTDSFCKLCNKLVLDYYEGSNCKNYEVKDEYK